MANGAESFSVARATAKSLFTYLNENVTYFSDKMIFQSGFVSCYATEHMIEYFMKPWVSCALTLGCLVPDMQSHIYLPVKKNVALHACHRFDQSVASILLYRLSGQESSKHIMRMETGLYTFCRGCTQ